jgi:Flp pilus assembly protein TadD
MAPPRAVPPQPPTVSVTNSVSPNPAEGKKQNGLRNSLIGGVIVVALIAVGGGGYLWHERANEQARAEQLAAEKQQMEERMRLAEETAKAREEALQAQAEQERVRVNAELALAKAVPSTNEPQVASNVPSTDGVEHAMMLLSDAVPKAEADRRKALSAKLQTEDLNAGSRLNAMQAQKIFSAAGIEPADASSAAARIQQTALAPPSSNALETALLSIDAMPKLPRGDRKAARSANDEGLRMMQSGRFEDATVAFNRAFAHDPADMEVLGNLSYAYLKNGQLAETLRISNYAVRVSPRRAGAWNQLAMAYAQRGADWLAVRAFMVLYALSGDQTKTREFLNRTMAENADERVRDAAKYALLALPESVVR